MANIKSAQKRIRQTAVRTARNRIVRSRVHTFIRKLEESIAQGDKTLAMDSFKVAMSELHSAAQKGVMKKNTVSRKISRLNARVKTM